MSLETQFPAAQRVGVTASLNLELNEIKTGTLMIGTTNWEKTGDDFELC